MTSDSELDPELLSAPVDGVYATWEAFVPILLDDSLLEADTDRSGYGRVPVDAARRRLLERSDRIDSESHANALIEALLDEGALERDGETLILFPASSFDGDSPAWVYNWAALVAVARARIDEYFDRLATADDPDVEPEPALVQSLQEMQQVFGEYEREIRRVARFGSTSAASVTSDDLVEMISMVPGAGERVDDETVRRIGEHLAELSSIVSPRSDLTPEEIDETLEELRSDRDAADDVKDKIDPESDDASSEPDG